MEALEELQMIKGIGEVRAKKLVDSGISSLDDLSKKGIPELKSLGLSSGMIGLIVEYFEDMEITEVDSEEDAEDEYETHLLEWNTEGYKVDAVKEELEGSEDKDAVIEKYQKAVEESRKLRSTLIDINVAELLQEAKKMLDMTFDLSKADQWEESFGDLMNKIQVRDLRYELEDLKTPQLEARIDQVIKKLNETMDVNAVTDEVGDVKREYQENFFVSEFVKDADDMIKRETVQVKHEVSKIPSKKMPIDDIYLFHGPKKMLLIKWYRHKESPDRGATGARNMVSEIRDYVRNQKSMKPRMVVKTKASDGKDIYITRGKTLLLAAPVSGELSEYGKKVLVNSINLIENVDGEALKTWNRKMGEPEYLEKVMKALLLLSLRNRK